MSLLTVNAALLTLTSLLTFLWALLDIFTRVSFVCLFWRWIGLFWYWKSFYMECLFWPWIGLFWHGTGPTEEHCNTLQHNATQCNTLQQNIPIPCSSPSFESTTGSLLNLGSFDLWIGLFWHGHHFGLPRRAPIILWQTAVDCNTVHCTATQTATRGVAMWRTPITLQRTAQQTATDCNRLQHMVSWCGGIALQCELITLQHATAHCSILQQTAAGCNRLQHVVLRCEWHLLHCSTQQHTAAYCNTPQHAAAYCNKLRHTATHCNTL